MRVLFLVQGEGRGHLTQALALAPMLRRAGHTVCAALVGAAPERLLPSFFVDEIGAPVERFEEPAFVYGARGLSLGPTAWSNLRRLSGIRRAPAVVRDAMARYRPDVVVSFYTFVAGRLGDVGVPVVGVGHQYAFHHPVYPFPHDRPGAAWAARFWTDRTVPPGARRLALSFYPADAMPDTNLRVVPPLLRDGVRARRSSDDGSLLVYLMHPALAPAIERWAAQHPGQEVRVFWDRKDAPETLAKGARLTFHRLNGERFLDAMARCRALVCTAGFESVCEAMHFGKPVLMVPIGGHFEQTCNAREASAHGAGLYASALTAEALDALLEHPYQTVAGFRAWADEAEGVFVEEVERAAGRAAHRIAA